MIQIAQAHAHGTQGPCRSLSSAIGSPLRPRRRLLWALEGGGGGGGDGRGGGDDSAVCGDGSGGLVYHNTAYDLQTKRAHFLLQ